MRRRFVAINHSKKRLAVVIGVILLSLIICIFSFKWLFGLLVKTIINEREQLNLLNMGTSNVKIIDLNLLSPNDILTVSLNMKKDDIKKLEVIPKDKREDGPLVYIYNTHDKEKFLDANVIYASQILGNELKTYGIPSLVEDKSVSKYLKANNKKESEAFIISRDFIDEAMRKYETLRYFVDIHTSDTSSDVTTIKINDDKYAKILFIVSMESDFYERTLEFAETLNSMLDKRLSRGIMKKTDTDNYYNQDMDAMCLTLEIGGYGSSKEEIDNTIKVLSGVLMEYMSEGYNGN